jgi:sodium-coupled neutral amino acid transporter 11
MECMQVTPDLPEAFAVMGFAFYCQPMLMPLLHEMPRGERGLRLTSGASSVTILVVATLVYGTLGVFGAARYGLETEGNILVNQWLGGRGEGILDLVMVAYLAISAPIVQVCPGLIPGLTT